MAEPRRSSRGRRRTDIFTPSALEQQQTQQEDAMKEGSAEWHYRRNMNVGTDFEEWERNSGYTIREGAKKEEIARRKREGVTSIYEPYIPTRNPRILHPSVGSQDFGTAFNPSKASTTVEWNVAFFEEFDSDATLMQADTELIEKADRGELVPQPTKKKNRGPVLDHVLHDGTQNPIANTQAITKEVSETPNGSAEAAADALSNGARHPYLKDPTKPVDRFNLRYFKKRKPASFYLQQAATYASDRKRDEGKGKKPAARSSTKNTVAVRAQPSEVQIRPTKKHRSDFRMPLVTPRNDDFRPGTRSAARPSTKKPAKPVANRGRRKGKHKEPLDESEHNIDDPNDYPDSDNKPAAQPADDTTSRPRSNARGKGKARDSAAVSAINIIDDEIDLNGIVDPELLSAAPRRHYLTRRTESSPVTPRRRSRIVPVTTTAEKTSRSTSTAKRARRTSTILLNQDIEMESGSKTKKARAQAEPVAKRGDARKSKEIDDSSNQQSDFRPGAAHSPISHPKSTSPMTPIETSRSRPAKSSASPTADAQASDSVKKGPVAGYFFPPPPSPQSSPGAYAAVSPPLERSREAIAETMATNSKAREANSKQDIDVSRAMKAFEDSFGKG